MPQRTPPPNRPPLIINIPDSRPRVQRRPSAAPSESHRTLIWWLVALTTAGVLFCGMFPFDFVIHFATVTEEIRRRFDTTINQLYTAGDGLENIVFFMPTGFALAGLLWNGRRTDWPRLAIAAICTIALGAMLSSVVELSQVFLVSRDPSLADICSNTTGTAVGFAVFFVVGPAVVRSVAVFLGKIALLATRRNLFIAAAAWLLIACLLPLIRGDVGSLHDWSPGYPLMVGNETSGDRFWNGTIRSFWIGDRALTDDEIDDAFTGKDPDQILGNRLLSEYKFNGRGPYPDQHGTGGTLHWIAGAAKLSAELSAHTSPSTRLSEPAPPDITAGVGMGVGAPTGNGWWLLSPDGAESTVSHRIALSNAFSLILDVQTDDLGQQDGPPRIISISRDVDRCNLQLLQNADALTIRLRTVATGDGGSDPEFVLPGVFTDASPVRIAITFHRGLLMATTNRLADRNAFQFSPESSLVWQIYPRPGWAFRLDSSGQNTCAKIYRMLAMLPIGLLIASAAKSRIQTVQPVWRSIAPEVFLSIAVAGVLEFSLLLESGHRPTVGSITVTVAVGVVATIMCSLARYPGIGRG